MGLSLVLGLRQYGVAATVLASLALLAALQTAPLALSTATAADPAQDDAQPPFEVVHQLGGLVTALAAHGDHVYVGIGSRLAILNADTPSGVPEGGNLGIRLPHTIKDAAVLPPGTVAVLAGDVVYFVDVVDPHAVAVVGTYAQNTPLRAVEARQGICFLLGDQAVHVVDAAEPDAARQVAAIDLPAPAKRSTKIVVGDGVLFIGGGIGSVLAYDVSRPDAPLLLGGHEEDLERSMMAVAGRTLYATHSPLLKDDDGNRRISTSILVLEVNRDNELVKHGFVTLVPPMPVPPDFHAVDIAAAGDHVYVAGSQDWADWGGYEHKVIRCWDLTDPTSPVAGPTVATGGIGSPVTMIAAEDRVYLGADDARLAEGGFQSPAIGVADIAEPGDMSWLGYWQLDDLGGVERVAASPTDVVIKEYAGLTHVYEGRYEAGHRPTGYIRESMRMSPLDYVLVRDRLYTVAVRDLMLFDLTDRALPTLRATAPIATTLPAMAVAEPLVLATTGSWVGLDEEPGYSLMVYQLSHGDRTELRLVGEVPAAEYVIQSIAVAGPYAFVVAYDGHPTPERIALFDIADPTLPQFVSNIELADDIMPKNLIIREDRAYVAVRSALGESETHYSGLVVLDVSVPRGTRVLGSVTTPTVVEPFVQPADRACQLALSGHYALYSCHEPVVHVIDVSEPARPEEAQRLGVAEIVTDLDAAAGQAYVVLKNGGMLVLRGTEPQPVPLDGQPAYVPLAVTKRHGAW